MGNYNKTVSIEDLRPGMFVSDVFNDKGILLFSSNTFLTGYHQIEHLRRQGVSKINVISHGYKPEESSVDISKDKNCVSEQFICFQAKLKQAYTVKRNTVEAVKSMMLAAKAGRFCISNHMIESLKNLMVEVVENPDVVIGITQIKDFDGQLYAHSVNVSVMMMGLAHILGYSKEGVLEAGIAGILHDIGMIRFPEEVARRERLQTRLESESFKKHPVYGVEIVQKYKELPGSALKVIAQHHERLNGNGYPNFLKGDQIEQLSIICALADVYDRLTTHGFASRACLPQEALALIFQGSDQEYPRKLVEYFTKLLGIYPVGSFVKLESGEMGLVIKINRDNLLSPQMVMLFNSGGRMVQNRYLRDLSMWHKESERELWKISCSLDPSSFGINPADVLYQNH